MFVFEFQVSMFSRVVHYLYLSRVILLCLVRLMEPGFLNSITNLCRRKQKSKVNVEEYDPNVLFLSSQMNNLIVCGILKGIKEQEKTRTTTHFEEIEMFKRISYYNER